MQTSFKNSIARLFASDEEKERLALQQIERDRQDREYARGIALQCADRKDRLSAAHAKYDSFVRMIDNDLAQRPTASNYADDLMRGATLEIVSKHASAYKAFEAIADDLKLALKEKLIGAAEKSLADFEKEHREILKKLPKLELAETPAFVTPAGAGYEALIPRNEPAPGVRQMMGLKPGEKIPAQPWETLGNNRAIVRDLDPD